MTGAHRKTRAECGSMEIPCGLTFKHGQKKDLDKLKLLLELLVIIQCYVYLKPTTCHISIVCFIYSIHIDKKYSDDC